MPSASTELVGVAVAPSAAPLVERSPGFGVAVRVHDVGKAASREAAVSGPGASSGGPTSSEPTDTAKGPTRRVATRIRVAALGIDLPVIVQPGSYPACNVAMYLTGFRQPGQGGPTYLYAHARTGMFLPLLQRSQVSNGSSMIGMRVEVYTGDNRRFVYRIDHVYRHVRDLHHVQRRKGESLWLQTSEGPRGTIPKLQISAALVSSGPASHAAAHPRPHPIACG